MGEAAYSHKMRRFLRDLRDAKEAPMIDPIPKGLPSVAMMFGLAEVVGDRLVITHKGKAAI